MLSGVVDPKLCRHTDERLLLKTAQSTFIAPADLDHRDESRMKLTGRWTSYEISRFGGTLNLCSRFSNTLESRVRFRSERTIPFLKA